MKLKTLALTSLTLLALAACGKQAETSVPADSAQGNTSAPAAPAALTEVSITPYCPIRFRNSRPAKSKYWNSSATSARIAPIWSRF